LTEGAASADRIIFGASSSNGTDTVKAFAAGTGADLAAIVNGDTSDNTSSGNATFETISVTEVAAGAAYGLSALTNTSDCDVYEFIDVNASNGDLSLSTTGSELLKLLSTSGTASGITLDGNGHKFYMIAYDNGNAYLYQGDGGGGSSTIDATEIKLVGIFESVSVGDFASGDFVIA
jgi:hypothetical protein